MPTNNRPCFKDRADKFGATPFADGVEYSEDEVEFMKAMDAYKREHNRPFPTCSEVLAVLKSLGYRQVEPIPVFNQERNDG